MTKSNYCFWSVCDGPFGVTMENCVRTARAAGVFTEFHVLTDRPLAGCECYDCLQFDKAHSLFKLHYLKAGMSRLTFEYYVWLDADTVFTRNPLDLLGVMGKSPLHVPLEVDLETVSEDAQWKGAAVGSLGRLLGQQGVRKPHYLCSSAFWIVHRDAIDTVHSLAFLFWHKAMEIGLRLDVSAALGYAMQMLCAAPDRHLLLNRPDLWATDYYSTTITSLQSLAWAWRHPLSSVETSVRPAIIHLNLGATAAQPAGKPFQ